MTLQERTRIALAHGRLRKAVLQGTSYMDGRRSGLAAAQGARWEAMRDAARAVRERSIARLPELVERVCAKARENGITVHFAGDAAEARSIVLGLAQARGAKSAVKMKSMLTQELGIREHLEDFVAALMDPTFDVAPGEVGHETVDRAQERRLAGPSESGDECKRSLLDH